MSIQLQRRGKQSKFCSVKDDQNLRTVFQMSCVTDRLERESSRNIRRVRTYSRESVL